MSDFFLQRLGTSLREMRKQRGLTQAVLAARAGLTRAKVIDVERGAAGVAAGTYARVANALGAELVLAPVRMPTLEEAQKFFEGDE